MKSILILLSLLLVSCYKSNSPIAEFINEIEVKDADRICEIVVDENYKSTCEWVDDDPNDYSNAELLMKRKEIYDIYYTSVFDILVNQEYAELTEKPILENEIFIFMSYTNEDEVEKNIYFYRDGYLKLAVNKEEYYYYSYDKNLIESIKSVFYDYYDQLSDYPIY